MVCLKHLFSIKRRTSLRSLKVKPAVLENHQEINIVKLEYTFWTASVFDECHDFEQLHTFFIVYAYHHR